jgi:hypothetical protein
MEISPIPGIRALPTVKTQPDDPRLSANFQIEPSRAPADDSYSSSNQNAAGGQDDEELTAADSQSSEENANHDSPSDQDDTPSVDLFA